MKCLEHIIQTQGSVGFYYRPLGGEAVMFNADLHLVAASVIKIPIMVEAFRRFEEGTLDPKSEVEIRPEMKKPSCGALTYMHDGLKVSVRDLVVLMIIVSDNTATNLLIDLLGVDAVNRTMAQHGIPGICLRRKLFEPELARQGIQNTITARGVGMLLEKMACGELLGKRTDAEMIGILKDQRLNGKLPFFLHSMDVPIAHKTGEDDGTTHDVGVIYAAHPFVVCMLSNDVDVPQFERLMQDAALELYRLNDERGNI